MQAIRIESDASPRAIRPNGGSQNLRKQKHSAREPRVLGGARVSCGFLGTHVDSYLSVWVVDISRFEVLCWASAKNDLVFTVASDNEAVEIAYNVTPPLRQMMRMRR